MFDNKKVKELVLSSLVADAYCLGSHWIYDEKQLENLEIDWNELNDAKSIWHKDKLAGDFTHYGDQTLWLYEFLQDKDTFDVKEYLIFWGNKINSYNGYIDGSSRITLENINDEKIPSGSSSTDLSIIGRISPLLLVSKTKQEFLENVENFVKCTHNSNEVISAAKIFASLLLEVLDGKMIEESILGLKEEFDTKIQTYIYSGIASKTDDSFNSIRDFGPACDINGGFQGVIHLLCKYDNLEELLIANAKAGGDSSSRAMIATIILVAHDSKNIANLPSSWLNIKAKIV